MKSRSTGTPAASRWYRPSAAAGSAGFTLLEALVALALVLAFAAVLGRFLFQARHIVANADGRVGAQVLLRSLLEIPLDRKQIGNSSRQGRTGDLQWEIAVQPMFIDVLVPRPQQQQAGGPTQPQQQQKQKQPTWTAYRLLASVSWAPGQTISAETVRLGETE
jgi:type II secretory pathway pseudopilin PulG